jgi:hypothetical protein
VAFGDRVKRVRRRHPVTGEFLPLFGPPLGYNAHRVPGGVRGTVALPMVTEWNGITLDPYDANPTGASIFYALAVEKLGARG